MALGFPPLGVGGFAGSSVVVPPSPVTDYFNGFELAGSTYSGGPVVTEDNTGALVTSPAGVLPITGMRLTDGVWYPTDLSGDPIHTSTPLRTRKGTVSVYDENYKGPLIEPARTNKVTCRKSNPVDTTNITKSGDDAAVLSVVDDSAALAAAGLSDICTSGKVYKLDNSAGAAEAYANFGGTTGNTNAHYGLCYMRAPTAAFGFLQAAGTGASGDSGVVFTATTGSYNGTVYVPFSFAITAGATSNFMRLRANAGAIVYFILPKLEEGAFTTSPIAKDSTGADPLTSLTRPVANLTRPTAGTALAALNNWATLIRFRPTAAGQTSVLWGSYTDADNATRLDLAPTTLTYTKRLAGANHVAQTSLTHAADTLYEALLYQHSVHGMGIAFRSWNGSAWSSWSTWVDLTDADGIANAAIAATYQIGAVNNSSHISANIPFTEIIRLNPNLHPQTQLADLLAKGRI